WIGPVACILISLFGERVNVGLIDAISAQPLIQAKCGDETLDEIDGYRIGAMVVELEQVQAASQTKAPVQARLAFGIQLHDVREANRISGAVVHAMQSGQWMRQGMGGAQILLKSDPSHSGGNQHFPARLRIAALFVSAR